MIDFTYRDENLWLISEASKLKGAETKNNYSIYGLANGDKAPVIKIDYNPEKVYIDKELKLLLTFLKKNKFGSEFETKKYGINISIGIRRDFRDHISLSAALLQTTVFTLEGLLNPNKEYHVPGIPNFG